MEIFYSKYQLQPGRNGALLKINGGYADCHPWPELGDLPIEEQLNLLKEGVKTALTKRSLHYAGLDREARKRKISLFQGLKIPKSHLYSEASSGTIKIKVGRHPVKDLELLKCFVGKPLTLRLDANERFTEEQFSIFLEMITPLHKQIEFIEDPFPYDPKRWKAYTQVPLACDRQSDIALQYPDSQKVLIVKPAINDPEKYKNASNKLVVTSYLDHPFGQVCAAYEAARLTQEVCGLLSHLVYPNDRFSQSLSIVERRLIPPKGTGFGFDSLLNTLSWEPL